MMNFLRPLAIHRKYRLFCTNKLGNDCNLFHQILASHCIYMENL